MSLLWLFLACTGNPQGEAPPQSSHAPIATPPASKLVVLVVIDQFPVRALAAVRPFLTGGLKRILEDGWQATGEYPYAVTYTCTGHATLVTGAAPNVHGVVSNAFLIGGQKTYCIDAPLLASSVGQVFKAGGGSVVGLSIKDRAAMLMGSTDGDLVAWYDRENPGWKPFRGEAPSDADSIRQWRSQAWVPTHDYSAVAPDDQLFEGSVDGLGRTFPRPVLSSLPADAFLLTPQAGGWLIDGAMSAVESLQLGQGAAPDLLAISFSQTDETGHVFTTESWEYMDTLVGVDRDLGRLMAQLDRLVGEGAWSMVLTGDHGSAPNPKRVSRDDVRTGLEAHLVAEGFPAGTYLSDPHVWLPLSAKGEERDRMARSAAGWLREVEGIAAAWPWMLSDGLPDDAPHAEAIRLSVHPDRAGDVYVIPEEGTILVGAGMPDFGTRHGTPYAYDTQVPLLVMGPSVPAGADESLQDQRRVASTLTSLAGLPRPAQAQVDALDWSEKPAYP